MYFAGGWVPVPVMKELIILGMLLVVIVYGLIYYLNHRGHGKTPGHRGSSETGHAKSRRHVKRH
jgi:hypothetical protein